MDRGTGREQDRARLDLAGATMGEVDFERLRVAETRLASDELEWAICNLRCAIAGELLDDLALAGDDRFPAESPQLCIQPELGAAPDIHRAVRGFEERLARHAAAQDAEATDGAAAFDERGTQAEPRSGRSTRITGTAAADHDEIVEITHAAP
jgi:hypothetical protein